MDEKVGITRLWKECTVKIYEESWKDCENDDETRFLRVIETEKIIMKNIIRNMEYTQTLYIYHRA